MKIEIKPSKKVRALALLGMAYIVVATVCITIIERNKQQVEEHS